MWHTRILTPTVLHPQDVMDGLRTHDARELKIRISCDGGILAFAKNRQLFRERPHTKNHSDEREKVEDWRYTIKQHHTVDKYGSGKYTSRLTDNRAQWIHGAVNPWICEDY